MTKGEIIEISEEEYHGDPCEQPSLSASIASVLIHQSPAHAHSVHPRLGGVKPKTTKDMDQGALIHRLLLDAGPGLEVIDAADYRTNAAKEKRDEARSLGRIPVLAGALSEATAIAKILRKRIEALGLNIDLASGHRETVICWQPETPHGRIWCRSKLDWHDPRYGLIVDLKKTVNAHPAALERSSITYGYEIQAAAYREAFHAVHDGWIGRDQFLFLFCELEPPFAVTAAEMAGSMSQLGTDRWERAKATWAQCLKTNAWPDYGPGIARLEAPAWAMNSEMMEGSVS